MSVLKTRKNNPHVLFTMDFPIKDFPNHYYRGHLWDDLQPMRDALKDDDDDYKDAAAACTHAHYIQEIQESGHAMNYAPRRMGELHFVTGIWDMEIVSHECFHAVTNICRVCNVHPAMHIEYEEFGAYIQGQLTGAVYKWLWDIDPKNGAVGFIWKWRSRILALLAGMKRNLIQDAPKTL